MTRVLLVDDEADILESTAELVAALGYEVATCAAVDEVIDAMRRERPDVVLHDVRMPHLDLPAHIRSIRADREVGPTALVLFTATLDVAELAMRVGADDGIEKPFDPERLVAVIERWANASRTDTA